ncbi:hypothetical protein E5676_scaffold3607G00010 [Cucumis melo var. makuwa]|uniref:Uncharacterized protein n=1 Tax=Cucumis melo var. makuwa TaxID=1194695 RepID=A0A5D3E311_CUCMM|nr:hypothetical protein E5676_scaffold3607G00010 [Cucumis melo var. makuwa]
MSGKVKIMSGKDLPTQSSTSGQTSREVSRDRLSRRRVGHASGKKPLLTSSFPTQTTTSGKPRLLSRRHVLRRESLPRQALPCSFVKEPVCRHYTESSRKALENIEKRRLAASYGRRKVEAEVAVAATDDNEDGRDDGELRTATGFSRRTAEAVSASRSRTTHASTSRIAVSRSRRPKPNHPRVYKPKPCRSAEAESRRFDPRVVPAWVSFGITTYLGLCGPTGHQSSMDIDMTQVTRRGPRISIVLGVPRGTEDQSYVPTGAHVARVRERARDWVEDEVRAKASWRAIGISASAYSCF